MKKFNKCASLRVPASYRVFQLARVDVGGLWPPCCFGGDCLIRCLLFSYWCQSTMTSYTLEQYVQTIKLYYQYECSFVQTLRALRPFYGKRGRLSQSTLQRLVAKFETTGSASNKLTPVRQMNDISTENITAIRESVQENPRRVRHAQGLGLPQTSTSRNLRSGLGPTPVQDPTDPGAQS